MRVVIAPDKFKGSLTAPEASEAIARGVLRADPTASVDLIPMADGGEGTVEALVAATAGTIVEAEVTGPLGMPVRARFGRLGDGRSAVLEMAAASGLALVPLGLRDPSLTSTRGTGELLLAALRSGAKRIILGIGGSATNDGGAGLAQVLGYRLLNAGGRDLPPGGGSLDRLARIDTTNRSPLLNGAEIDIACDVDNPLCGPHGASAVYGPQKGATPEMVKILDASLARLAEIIARDLGRDVAEWPGAGAAGGLGAGLVAFANGRLRRGIELVIDAVGLAKRLEGADLCLTGEGSIDGSSAFGKTAVGVARQARTVGCPTIALVGAIGPDAENVLAEGISAYYSLCPAPITLDEAMRNAAAYLERLAEQVVQTYVACRQGPSR